MTVKVSGSLDHSAVATFAGGCFWCMEPPFTKLDGVIKVLPGYMGGKKKNPTYEEVCTGKTGHAEVVHIIYDPGVVSFDQLLEVFWQNIDPTDEGGQFVDRGNQYRTEIFFHNEAQRESARVSKQRLANSGQFVRPIVTAISPATEFYPAEDYHQQYYKKSASCYIKYRNASGRDNFLIENWTQRNSEDSL